jgi:hypothetical protein
VFGSRYFSPRYFAARFFGRATGVPTVDIPEGPRALLLEHAVRSFYFEVGMADLRRAVTWVQFDEGGTKRFQLQADRVPVATAGLTCQFRMQRIDRNGTPIGAPITAAAVADDATFWRIGVVAEMTAVAGDYEVEARGENGAGEVGRWPDEGKALITVRPVRTGGAS